MCGTNPLLNYGRVSRMCIYVRIVYFCHFEKSVDIDCFESTTLWTPNTFRCKTGRTVISHSFRHVNSRRICLCSYFTMSWNSAN